MNISLKVKAGIDKLKGITNTGINWLNSKPRDERENDSYKDKHSEQIDQSKINELKKETEMEISKILEKLEVHYSDVNPTLEKIDQTLGAVSNEVKIFLSRHGKNYPKLMALGETLGRATFMKIAIATSIALGTSSTVAAPALTGVAAFVAYKFVKNHQNDQKIRNAIEKFNNILSNLNQYPEYFEKEIEDIKAAIELLEERTSSPVKEKS